MPPSGMTDANIKIRIESDAKGAGEAVTALDRVERKAKGSGQAIGKSLDRIAAAGERVKRITGALVNLSFLTGGIASVVSLWEAYTGKVKAAKKAADDLARANQAAADAKAVETLTEAYGRLERQIGAAATARVRANELIDADAANARELEDLSASAERDSELAALDPADPLYQQRKAQIEARHGAAAANRAAARKVEDAERRAERTGQESVAMAEEAGARSLALQGDRDELHRLEGLLGRANAAATSDNYADNATFGDHFFHNVKSIISGNWSRVGDSRTEEGDQIRREAETRAKELQEQIKAKERDIGEKERKIAELEEGATFLRERMARQRISVENAKDAQVAVSTQGHRSEAAAATALSDGLTAITAENARNSDARLAMAQLTAERRRIESQISFQQGRKDEASLAVFNAQGAADLARANGDRRGYAEGTANLNAAKGAAEEVNHSADSMINSLMQTLNSINQRIRAAEEQIRRSSSQSQYAWREVPGE